MSRPAAGCTINEMQILRQYTSDEVWSVNEDGHRDEFHNTTDDVWYPGVELYVCGNDCGGEQFETWDEAKRHFTK